MAVLRDMARAAGKLVQPIADALASEPAPELDRGTVLQRATDEAAKGVQAAREDLEFAYFELEEGAPDRIAAAEEALRQADGTFQRAQRSLTAYNAVQQHRAAEEARKARKAAWDLAEDLAQQRIAAARRLADALNTAGEHYAELSRLGGEIYNAIPSEVRWAGGPASYRLSTGNTAAIVGIDLQKAGLPDGSHLSLSMLSQYQSMAEIAASNLAMVRMQRAADEARG